MEDVPYGRSSRVYDVLYAAAGKDYAVEAEELDRLIQAHRPGSRSLLDVACGTGAHLLHLADRYDVDASASMVAEAKGRLPGVRFVEADMRSFDLGRRFDAVTCLFSAIGYMPSTEDLSTAIETMARHLDDRGVLIIDGWVRPDAWHDPGSVQALCGHADGIAVARVVHSRRADNRSTLDLRFLIETVDGVEHLEETHDLMLFSDDDYRAAFDIAGLRVEIHPSPHPDRDRYVGVKLG